MGRRPASTYRLQLNADFGFDAAAALVPHLHRLGIDWVYASPILQARAGSTHGYDVVDPTRLNPELGGEVALRRLADALHDAGMGLLLDIVPNHMAADASNPMWRDVLEHGTESGYATFFDIWSLAPLRYRRFFDIDDLVGMRQEDARAFEATHALIAHLVDEGIVDGVRVDHIDGLLDPADYLARLKLRLFAGAGGYVIVEKILERDERLPGDWAVDGTTGYDYIDHANGLGVSIAGLDALTAFYKRFTGLNASFDDVVFRRKMQVQEALFGAELDRLVDILAPLVDRRIQRDVLRVALAAVTAGMARYRTYFARDRVRPEDQHVVLCALAEARRRQADVPAEVYDELEPILLLADTPPSLLDQWLDFVMRWQQYTGPVMAKGHEDTAMYVYNRLISANAVGGDPADPIATVAGFQRWLVERREWVGTMNAASTHDSKRSEDVRTRIDVLTEVPDLTIEAFDRWHALNESLRGEAGGQHVPDPNTEMLVYQTLVGAWPIERTDEPEFGDRLRDYLTKATREGKTYTSWRDPNEPWERALHDWTRAILDPAHDFVDELRAFVDRIAPVAALASLAQLLLRVAAPGVPDFYQGTELWALTLVDPDNRRPIDYTRSARMLDEVEALVEHPTAAGAAELLRDWRTGAIKLFVTAAALRDRRAHSRLYHAGEHIGVPGMGPASAHMCGFTRRFGGEWRVCLVPLRTEELKRRLGHNDTPSPWADTPSPWADTTAVLPPDAPRSWRNRLTGEVLEASDGELPLPEAFRSIPLALLEPAS